MRHLPGTGTAERNDLAAEQAFAADLGATVEMPATPAGITIDRLTMLFRPVLRKFAMTRQTRAKNSSRNFSKAPSRTWPPRASANTSVLSLELRGSMPSYAPSSMRGLPRLVTRVLAENHSLEGSMGAPASSAGPSSACAAPSPRPAWLCPTFRLATSKFS